MLTSVVYLGENRVVKSSYLKTSVVVNLYKYIYIVGEAVSTLWGTHYKA